MMEAAHRMSGRELIEKPLAGPKLARVGFSSLPVK
jgi:hypothetical protein